MTRRIPDNYWYAPYRGKWTAVGGTMICDTEEDAKVFEKEYYESIGEKYEYD